MNPPKNNTPPTRGPRSIDWQIYEEYGLAYAACDILQRITGDRCKVIRLRDNHKFTILRKDISGRLVDQ